MEHAPRRQLELGHLCAHARAAPRARARIDARASGANARPRLCVSPRKTLLS